MLHFSLGKIMSFHKAAHVLLVIAALAFSCSSNLYAQSIVTVSEGTEVKVRLLDNLSSNNAVQGQKFNLELDQDLRLNNQVVIQRGAKVIGNVVSARKKGFMGKAGELNINIDYLLLGDQRIALRATNASEGKSKVGTTVALTVLFGPIGLLKRGKDIELNSGTTFTAFIDQTVQIPATMQAMATAPMTTQTEMQKSEAAPVEKSMEEIVPTEKK
jgi:hypothetical protein